jgi:hypothetical protein
LLTGIAFASQCIWIVGNCIGKKNSQRVLFRRLAIVYTVILSGYSFSHLEPLYGYPPLLSSVFYAWGFFLGYFAIREQFSLNHFETTVMGFFAGLLILISWQFLNQWTFYFAENIQIAPSKTMVSSRAFSYQQVLVRSQHSPH